MGRSVGSRSGGVSTKRGALGKEAHPQLVKLWLPVTLRPTHLAPDVVRIGPSLRLAEEIDDPVRVTKMVGFDEHASERDQFILVRPPLTAAIVATFVRRRHYAIVTRIAGRIDPELRAGLTLEFALAAASAQRNSRDCLLESHGDVAAHATASGR